MKKIQRFFFKFQIWYVKVKYYEVYYELLNEHRLEKTLMPWKVYLIQYLRNAQNSTKK